MKFWSIAFTVASLIAGIAAVVTFIAPAKIEARDPAFSIRGDILHYGSNPFAGVFVERYGNGLRYRETQYKHGIKDGFFRQYALNGRVVASGKFAHGQRDGFAQGWFSEGPKKFEYRFKNGLLDGTQTEWHLSGAVFRREVYESGKLVDKKILYPQGEIFTNFANRDKRLYGIDGGSLCMETKKEGAR